MKKEVICLFVSMLLIFALLPTIQSSESHNTNKLGSRKIEFEPLELDIITPEKGFLYINNKKVLPLLLFTIVVGPITIEVDVTADQPVERLEFYQGSTLEHTDYYPPYTWELDETSLFKQTITVKAYTYEGDTNQDEIKFWMFSLGKTNAPPSPIIIEPAGNGILFDPSWEQAIITTSPVTIAAVDEYYAEDITLTTFEYSPDGSIWHAIGSDSYGGFDGFILDNGDDRKIGTSGWSTIWDITGLSEGTYQVKVIMTDEDGQTGETIETVYYDPVPPLPEIIQPGYGHMVQGIVNFHAQTMATNVVSMTLSLFGTQGRNGGSGWYNQTGLGSEQQTGQTCAPTAAANSMAGLGNPNLYPPGQAGNNSALADALGDNMSTNPATGTNAWRPTNGSNNEHETDNVGSGIESYLEAIGLGCSNDEGYEVTVYRIRMQHNATTNGWYPVAGSNEIDWDDFDSEIRKNEAVIIDSRPWDHGPDGVPGTEDDTTGGGHAVSGRGSNGNANPDGSHDIGIVDPADGQNHTTSMGSAGGFSTIEYPPGSGNHQLITGIWAISPKNQTNVSIIDIDTDPTDEWVIPWDTTPQPEGYYTLFIDMVDTNNVLGREVITVLVDNTPPETEEEVGDPNWEEGYVVTAYTPIWLNATDIGSGVQHIVYETWWDSDGDEIVDVVTYVNVVESDTVELYFGDCEIYSGIAEIHCFAVDFAGNMEEMKIFDHLVIY